MCGGVVMWRGVVYGGAVWRGAAWCGVAWRGAAHRGVARRSVGEPTWACVVGVLLLRPQRRPITARAP